MRRFLAQLLLTNLARVAASMPAKAKMSEKRWSQGSIALAFLLVCLVSTSAHADTFEETVFAGSPWEETDLSLGLGDTFSITADGFWRHDNCCGGLYGPDGSPLENDAFSFITDSRADKGALIGAIVPSGESFPFAQNDSRFFNVGSSLPSFTADYPGKLHLGFNDTITPDNLGSVMATIMSPAGSGGGESPKTYGLFIGVDYDQSPEMNTQEDAELLFEKFSRIVEFENADSAILKLGNNPSNKESIGDLTETLADQINPNDRFVFYFGGHGTTAGQSDGGEAPVDDVKKGDPIDGNMSDEFLQVSGASIALREDRDFISDDEFRLLFADDRWSSIDKTFILDACYTGGFIGDPTSPEWADEKQGDLNKLNDFRLFAAAPENELTKSVNQFLQPLVGDHGYYSLGVMRYLDGIEEAGDDLSWSGLNDFLNNDWVKFLLPYDNSSSLVREWLPDEIETTFNIEEDWHPFYYSNTSFGDVIDNIQNPVVPEPSSFILFCLGVLGLGRARAKRRR